MPYRLARFFARNHIPLPSGWWLELFSATTVTMWAILTLWAETDFSQQATYRLALRVMDGDNWKYVGLLLGIVQLAACQSKCTVSRTITASFTMVWYFALAWSLLFSSFPNYQGFVMYMSYGLMNVVAIRLLNRKLY